MIRPLYSIYFIKAVLRRCVVCHMISSVAVSLWCDSAVSCLRWIECTVNWKDTKRKKRRNVYDITKVRSLQNCGRVCYLELFLCCLCVCVCESDNNYVHWKKICSCWWKKASLGTRYRVVYSHHSIRGSSGINVTRMQEDSGNWISVTVVFE